MIHLHSYHGTQNLGDAIQSIALLRLCKELRPDLTFGWVDRDQAVGHHDSPPVLANGWLGDRWKPPLSPVELAGVHCATPKAFGAAHAVHHHLSKLPIGARDPRTHQRFTDMGVTSELIGCATLTLPRYEGIRVNATLVDASGEWHPAMNSQSITHLIPTDYQWKQQQLLAHQYLKLYQQSHEVYTSRLHVLLPCIAFGTPVALTHIPKGEDARFSLASYLGVKVGDPPKVYTDTPVVQDLIAKFREFTLAALNRLAPLPA
jgi:hypothetical protein